MISFALLAASLAAAPAGVRAPDTPAPMPGLRYADVLIRQRVIIRVPTRDLPPPQITQWREKKAKKCIPGRPIAGAVLVSPDTVDFVLAEGLRIRAKLETSCPALDYYRGFYLRPDADDGLICAKRDAIHARSGGECVISRFRRLVPDRD